MDKRYKFKDLKVFSSTESMMGNTRRYRTVFENKETTYIYAELSFYNKLFDEEDWSAKVTLKAYQLKKEGREELCKLDKDVTVTKDKNIVTVREGWGNDDPGAYWHRGDYEWEAYIDDVFVGKQKFYVESGGLVTDTSNPYFNLKSIKLYEGPNEGVSKESRKYLTKFNAAETRFLWVEIVIENLQTQSWYCELFINYYNDAGQLKGGTSEIKYVASTDKEVTILTGWGSSTKGTWFNDKYRLEITFMDHLVAVVPFEMANEFVEGESPLYSSSEKVFTIKNVSSDSTRQETLDDVLRSLNEMIGLTNVKNKINDYTSYLKFLKVRREQGFEEPGKISLHAVFTGNPGTGKTTVAKMLGAIYHKMGLLSKGKVLEVGRAELVGKFIGQTAPQTKEIIDKARGGILFIDEAYSLMREGDAGNDFGQEVIEVLIKEMSDGRGDLAVILAGYPKEMNHLLNANPGLKSRFNLYFEFEDYLPQELMEIARYATRKKGVVFSPESESFMFEKLTEAYRNRDRTFGNARMVNSWVDEAKMNMGLRIMRTKDDLDKISPEELKTIQLEDVKAIFKTTNRELPDIRIDEALLSESLNELNKLIGMESVKEEVHEIVKLVRFYRETGKNVLNKFSLHTVFTGNPGTGKTTVARIIAKIYKALGILERGHIVEVDRQGLVAGYVGQTAIKTMDVIERALGGVLFIDEAYALSQAGENDFGREAIETLLKQMEDRRGHFIVIVAGYTDNMAHFLETNPGLKSRFDKTIFFPDYSTEELYTIAISMLAQEGLTPDHAAAEHLKKYLEILYSKRDKFFGNARSVRKVVKEAVKEQHLRMASLTPDQRTQEALSTLTLEDLKDFKLDSSEYEYTKRIGFRIYK
ncbi:MAG: AAA family ATPase [Cytophagaceae bacterium]|nr:AAA family ATPase [Cytophagaceae bacterium]MDW8456415.1 AAA family ATPase [Cytophagaceae bacterium]